MVEFDSSILAKLVAYTSDNGTLAEAIVEEFLVSAPGLLGSISDALSQKDLQAIADHAATLRATSASLGLIWVSELCGDLEYGTLLSASKAVPELSNAVVRGMSWLMQWQRGRSHQVA